MLMDFEAWTPMIAELDVFGLPEEERVLNDEAAALEEEITALGRSDSSTREDVAPDWQVRRRLRRRLRRDHGRKIRALQRYREYLINEGRERLDSPEALEFLREAAKA